jgi:hypothetical protein
VTDATTEQRTAKQDELHSTITWLEEQFPGWTIHVDETDTGVGELRPIWIASREGHHAQAELSASKLHTRLADYLDREERREALMN